MCPLIVIRDHKVIAHMVTCLIYYQTQLSALKMFGVSSPSISQYGEGYSEGQ